MEKRRRPRGWWNTSFRDKSRAKYQADVFAATVAEQSPVVAAEQLNEAYRRGWLEGREALLVEQRAQRQG